MNAYSQLFLVITVLFASISAKLHPSEDFSQNPEQVAQIQDTLLKLFRLDSVPKRIPARDRVHVPAFMMDMYRMFEAEQQISPSNYEEVLDANTVRSFTHEGKNKLYQITHFIYWYFNFCTGSKNVDEEIVIK